MHIDNVAGTLNLRPAPLIRLLEDAVPPMDKDNVWGILREGFKSENGDGPDPSEVP